MMSGYLLCGRVLRARVPLTAYVTLCYGASGLLLALGARAAGQALGPFSAGTWLLLAALALGPTLIGHTSVNYALRHLPSGKVALAIVGEPIVSAALAWWLLAEPLTLERGAAGALLLSGIVVGARAKPS